METVKKIDEKKLMTKSKEVDFKKTRNELHKEENKAKKRFKKISMIPKLKLEKDQKCYYQKQKQFSSVLKAPSSHFKENNQNLNCEKKLKFLESKEESISEYYDKIEELLRKLMIQEKIPNKRQCQKSLQFKNSLNSSSARKMTSDPLIFNKTKVQTNVLNVFENDVQQISNIWMRTSTDLSNTLNNLSNSALLDPVQFKVESMRIQMAIKQAKSLTLVKSRSVIAEAKKLIVHQEIIKTELESLMAYKKNQNKSCECLKEKCHQIKGIKTGIEEIMNMSDKVDSGQAINKAPNPFNYNSSVTEKDEKNHAFELKKPSYKCNSTCVEAKEKLLDKEVENFLTPNSSFVIPTQTISNKSYDFWAAEISKKNETITRLNNKVFELQKACNEHSQKYSQMQLKLLDFGEKIQWNQVLWKQIGKLKHQMKELQQSNKQLESQKKELELRVTKMDHELDRLIKLNHLLQRKKCIGDTPKKFIDCASNECEDETQEENYNIKGVSGFKKKVFTEKQNVINHLKMILELMRDQETMAQKQIEVFESKINELEEMKKNYK